MKIVLLPNYNISMEEVLFPAADLCEHISLPRVFSSGVSVMKMAFNGGLVLGSHCDIILELVREVEYENLFTFGLRPEEISARLEDVS